MKTVSPASAGAADKLNFMLRSPAIVESAIRASVCEWVEKRRLGGSPIDPREFGSLALAALEREMEDERRPLDRVSRHELEGATLAVLGRFLQSKLAKRLAAFPSSRIEQKSPGSDLRLRDSRGNVHVIRFETAADAQARIELARSVSRGAAGKGTQLRQPSVHLFSLRDGRLRSYDGATFSGSRRVERTDDVRVRRTA